MAEIVEGLGGIGGRTLGGLARDAVAVAGVMNEAKVFAAVKELEFVVDVVGWEEEAEFENCAKFTMAALSNAS